MTSGSASQCSNPTELIVQGVGLQPQAGTHGTAPDKLTQAGKCSFKEVVRPQPGRTQPGVSLAIHVASFSVTTVSATLCDVKD